jgi:hypothetical protein
MTEETEKPESAKLTCQSPIQFGLDNTQYVKLSTWIKEQEKIACEMQLKNVEDSLKERLDDKWLLSRREELKGGLAYYGAIGGALTFSFTPNSIGLGVSVAHGYTKNSIDLSDYENW